MSLLVLLIPIAIVVMASWNSVARPPNGPDYIGHVRGFASNAWRPR